MDRNITENLGVRYKPRNHEKGARHLSVRHACIFFDLAEPADDLFKKSHQGFDAILVVAFGSDIAVPLCPLLGKFRTAGSTSKSRDSFSVA